MDLILESLSFVWDSALDVAPIVLFLFAFQLFVLRERIPNLDQILVGFAVELVGQVFEAPQRSVVGKRPGVVDKRVRVVERVASDGGFANVGDHDLGGPFQSRRRWVVTEPLVEFRGKLLPAPGQALGRVLGGGGR